MDVILKFAHTSCHHGSSIKPNQLIPALNILKNNIDIIEIDFIYYNNQYISAHDESEVEHGSELSLWIDEIIKLDNILWIDLKDTQLSFFLNSYSTINVDYLFELLNKLHLKYKNLHQHILIGCQYSHVYQALMKQSMFTIIRDLPRDSMYFLEALSPCQLFESISVSSIIDDVIMHHQYQTTSIIAIDRHFFTTNVLINLLNTISFTIIILYNYNQDDEVLYIRNKHIIHQYNY